MQCATKEPIGFQGDPGTSDMELKLYGKLSTRSRRAMSRKQGRFGKPYHYHPRWNLVQRLSAETGMTAEQIYHQIYQERQYLLDNWQ